MKMSIGTDKSEKGRMKQKQKTTNLSRKKEISFLENKKLKMLKDESTYRNDRRRRN